MCAMDCTPTSVCNCTMLVVDVTFDCVLLKTDELMRIMFWCSHLYFWYAQWFDGTGRALSIELIKSLYDTH
jgi:hypothetical protein